MPGAMALPATARQAAGLAAVAARPSRETALEFVRRISHVKPIYGAQLFLARYPDRSKVNHVTRETLAEVCSDPALGFMVDTVDVDAAGVALQTAKKQSYRLYDCRAIRKLGANFVSGEAK